MPPKRYINESSDPKSRYSEGKHNISLTNSKDTHLKARSSHDHRHMKVMSLPLVKEESIGGASNRPPLEVCVRRGWPKKHQSILEELETDEDEFTIESEDDSVTTKRSSKDRNDWRKNQRFIAGSFENSRL